jgi:hypothetical protein
MYVVFILFRKQILKNEQMVDESDGESIKHATEREQRNSPNLFDIIIMPREMYSNGKYWGYNLSRIPTILDI